MNFATPPGRRPIKTANIFKCLIWRRRYVLRAVLSALCRTGIIQ